MAKIVASVIRVLVLPEAITLEIQKKIFDLTAIRKSHGLRKQKS